MKLFMISLIILNLKQKGYAFLTMNLKNIKRSELVKLDIWVNGEGVDALSFYCA